MFSQDDWGQPRISVFQRLRKVCEPKQNNIQIRKQKRWKLKKKKQHPRSLGWVCEQNDISQFEQVEQVNVVSIVDEEDAQNFEFPCQEALKHHQIATTDHKMCDEVQVNSPKSLSDDLTSKQEPPQDFVEAVQPAPQEMKNDS